MTSTPSLRYLNAVAIEAAMPPLDERLELAELTLRALTGRAQLPAKIGVMPRPVASFGHAMPAFLSGADPDGRDDLLGIKWVVGVPSNGQLGLPALHSLALLNDPQTGVPTAILDASPITAERTAAVSGVAIRAFGPGSDSRNPRVALIGAGVQGRSHVPVIGYVLPGAELQIHDRLPERAEALAAHARTIEGIERVNVVDDPRTATQDADVVVTAVSFGPVQQTMDRDWFAPDALIVAIDYATSIAADVAREAALFLVDHRDQFVATCEGGAFEGYPRDVEMVGEALERGASRPSSGLTLVTHLGVGLADVVFGDAILRRARAEHLGIELPR